MEKKAMSRSRVFSSALGFMAITTRSGAVTGLTMGHPDADAARRAIPPQTDRRDEPPDGVDQWIARLQRLANGEPTDFGDVPVDDDGWTRFQWRVLCACRAIPWGQTRTYGELARAVGHPGAARAVGSVMARNRVPLLIPCHRVIPASGGWGGFSAPQGVAMKRRLLKLEQRQC